MAPKTGRKSKPPPTGYDRHRERTAKRERVQSASGRDIGDLPAVANIRRKNKARRKFLSFCDKYFPETFYMKWSPDHLKVIDKIERAVLHGGLFAMAMPRGSGKTSLCETACIWAILYGHREFVALIGSDQDHALKMLESIKTEFENNDRLLADFPDVIFPICALDGIHQRSGGQLYRGKRTHIGWTANEIILPTMPDSVASGAIICVASLTGGIRGMKHKRIDGVSIRPSLALVDDPQTDQSAASVSQCATREAILAGAILGLAGPGCKIAALLALTVIREEDMADRILNPELHPQWQGERTKMIYSFPSHESLWAKYAELWQEGFVSGSGIVDATKFYRKNRSAMDKGAKVAWKARFNPDEVSALQHAMNLKLQGEAAFFAEYQNEPLKDELDSGGLLTADEIAAKTNGAKPGEVPVGATHLTMFIDVHANALFWMLAAWGSDFTGAVIAYGTEPDQGRGDFTLRNLKRKLLDRVAGAGLEAAIFAGLTRLTDATLGREWRRDDGTMMRIDRCAIDANWGTTSDVVYQFCRGSKYAGILIPSRGRYVGASSMPYSEYSKKRGDLVGLNWRIPGASIRRSVRHVAFDTNFWKSFVHSRLAVPMGDPGCLSFFGSNPAQNRLLADHLTAEYRVQTEGRGRTVDEWKIRAEGRDNHWLDCMVGCAVCASMQGATLFGVHPQPAARKQYTQKDFQRR